MPYSTFNKSMATEFKDNPDNSFFTITSDFYNNMTMPEQPVSNRSILAFLLSNFPSYIEMVPSHWLSQDLPSHGIQAFVSIAFLIIGIPANIGHILVFLAFAKYVLKYLYLFSVGKSEKSSSLNSVNDLNHIHM